MEAQERTDRARRFTHETRTRLTVIILVCVALGVYYQIAHWGGLQQTSALFIGLPALLGLLTVHLSSAKGLFGRIVQVNVIFLAIVAPLLGEGSVCLICAAPIFFALSFVVASISLAAQGERRTARVFAFVALPFVLGVIQKHTDWLTPRVQVVETRYVVAGNAEAWRAALLESAPIPEIRSPLLSLGFPLPERYVVDGTRAEVAFSRSEGVRGSWRVELSATEHGATFRVLEDTSKIGHWMRVIDSRVKVVDLGNGRVALEQRTRFLPRLHPLVYFVPAQRAALRDVHELARDAWSRSVERASIGG